MVCATEEAGRGVIDFGYSDFLTNVKSITKHHKCVKIYKVVLKYRCIDWKANITEKS